MCSAGRRAPGRRGRSGHRGTCCAGPCSAWPAALSATRPPRPPRFAPPRLTHPQRAALWRPGSPSPDQPGPMPRPPRPPRPLPLVLTAAPARSALALDQSCPACHPLPPPPHCHPRAAQLHKLIPSAQTESSRRPRWHCGLSGLSGLSGLPGSTSLTRRFIELEEMTWSSNFVAALLPFLLVSLRDAYYRDCVCYRLQWLRKEGEEKLTCVTSKQTRGQL